MGGIEPAGLVLRLLQREAIAAAEHLGIMAALVDADGVGFGMEVRNDRITDQAAHGAAAAGVELAVPGQPGEVAGFRFSGAEEAQGKPRAWALQTLERGPAGLPFGQLGQRGDQKHQGMGHGAILARPQGHFIDS